MNVKENARAPSAEGRFFGFTVGLWQGRGVTANVLILARGERG